MLNHFLTVHWNRKGKIHSQRMQAGDANGIIDYNMEDSTRKHNKQFNKDSTVSKQLISEWDV